MAYLHLQYTGRLIYLWSRRFHSKKTTPAATDTFSDEILPDIGIRTNRSQCLRTCSCNPLPSPPSKKAVGEASTNYLHDGQAPRRMHERIPDARLIVVLRNPIERAYSHYWMYRLAGRETETFARALDREEDRRAKHWGSGWQYVRTGYYARHIRRYLEFFPKEKLLITLYEDFERDPALFMRELFGFLEVDGDFSPSMNVRYNVSGRPTSALSKFLLTSRHPVRQTLKELIPRSVRLHLSAKLRQRYLSKPPMPAECRDRLRTTYRADIADLEQMLGRSLAHWTH